MISRNNQSLGLVIKSFQPQKNKLAILDYTLGRIDGIVVEKTYVNGSLLCYSFDQSGLQYILKNIVIEEIPFELAQHDILFLHHFLELCYYFIPPSSHAPRIFDEIEFLYKKNDIFWCNSTKKLFLFRMLVNIGLYTNVPAISKRVLHCLINQPMLDDSTQALAFEHQEEIKQWLHLCISEHPHVEKFNTLQFLTRE